jgi:hypothetical protein
VTVSGNTSLLPFRKASGGFWTPNDVEKTETFGYSYPETFKPVSHVKEHVNEHEGNEGEDEKDEEDEEEDWDLSARASASVARLYSPSARDMLTANPATAGGTVQLVANGTFTDWAIATEALAHELPSTFIVRFSLTGDFSSDPSVDVGSWVNAMPQSHEEMRKRTATIEHTYKSSISLTSNLLDQIKAGKLESLDAKDVVPYLTDKLSWRVLRVRISHSGASINADDKTGRRHIPPTKRSRPSNLRSRQHESVHPARRRQAHLVQRQSGQTPRGYERQSGRRGSLILPGYFPLLQAIMISAKP